MVGPGIKISEAREREREAGAMDPGAGITGQDPTWAKTLVVWVQGSCSLAVLQSCSAAVWAAVTEEEMAAVWVSQFG